MRHKWRVVVDGPASGSWNMSVDEALLQAARQGLAPVTLRFYRWTPPTLSLGYFQDAGEVSLETLRQLGLGLVRRPTGGRAILHDDELTYSIVLPATAIPGGQSLGRSYRQISAALMAGLRRLGLQARMGAEEARRDNLPAACFALSTRADLTAAGHKIIGSAQVRRDGFILQHGSIPLTLDREKHARVFPAREDTQKLAAKAAGLVDILGRRPPWEELVEAFVAGFSEVLGADFVPSSLLPEEQQMAKHIEQEKYGRQEFNLRQPAGPAPDCGPQT
ncbi:MAG: lipoate--protein ligase family protein [Armatimonadetes bacterium]|nr:lipoate--protein ligase family protein [Armatimonadota bacterium]